jgi:hypothetical protein
VCDLDREREKKKSNQIVTMSSSDGNNNKDELVSQFIAFTGSSDTERASMYLEMSGGNLETAVGLFMEHQGAGGGGAGGASSSSQQDPFAAAAGGGMGGGDDVRAPDATQTMRLMDDHAGPRGIGMMGMGMGMGNPYVPMMDPMIQQQLATSAFARDVVNNAAADDDNNMNNGEDDDSNYNNDDDDDDDDDSGNVNGNGNVNGDSSGRRSSRNSSSRNSSSSNNNSNRATGLADMFAPPRHLLCNENFEGARAMAKDSKRWLLVNIQRDNEFSCHALNRDVWRDELVENLIGEGFIFWQKVRTHIIEISYQNVLFSTVILLYYLFFTIQSLFILFHSSLCYENILTIFCSFFINY